MRSVPLGIARTPLGAGDVLGLEVLVVVAGPLDGAADRPRRVQARCAAGPLAEVVALADVPAVGLLGVAPGQSLLVEVGQPAALVTRGAVGVLVELEHARDRPLEERPVVADHDQPASRSSTKRSRRSSPSKSRSLVGSSRRKTSNRLRSTAASSSAGRLAARERGGRLVEHAVAAGRARPAARRCAPRGRRRRAPASGRGRRRSGRRLPSAAADERVGGGLQLGRSPRPRRCGGPGGRGHGLAGPALGLLGQVADGRGRRGELDRPAVRDQQAGQRQQQRGLAHPVGTDHADPVAGRDGQVDAVEDRRRAAAEGEIASRERGGQGRAPEGREAGRGRSSCSTSPARLTVEGCGRLGDSLDLEPQRLQDLDGEEVLGAPCRPLHVDEVGRAPRSGPSARRRQTDRTPPRRARRTRGGRRCADDVEVAGICGERGVHGRRQRVGVERDDDVLRHVPQPRVELRRARRPTARGWASTARRTRRGHW